jgi:hypothetical protein
MTQYSTELPSVGVSSLSRALVVSTDGPVIPFKTINQYHDLDEEVQIVLVSAFKTAFI